MNKTKKHSALITMFFELKHYGLFTMVIIFSILATARDLACAVTLGQAVNAVKSGTNVVNALILMAVASLSGLPIRGFLSYFENKYTCSCQRHLLNRLTQHVQDISMADFEMYQSGDIISTYTNETDRLITWLSRILPDGVRLLAYTIGMFAYGLSENVLLTIIVYPVILIIAPLLTRFSKSLGDSSKKERESASKFLVKTQEILMNPEMIKTFSIEAIMNKRAEAALTQRANVEKKSANISAITNCIAVLGSFIPGFITAVVGVFFVVKGWISIGFLVSFVQIAITRIGSILNRASTLINLTRKAEASAVRVKDFLSLSHERTHGETEIPKQTDKVVCFENVSFSYPNKDKAIKNISFEIKQGETVALVGASGCGKSTILKMLLGFYEPQEGNIRIYNRKIKDWNLSKLRDLYAIVFQDLFLFPVSIKENLTAVKPNATEDELKNAITAAELDEFISELPNGIDTIMGERGVNISGGQRQRLTIARALIKNSPILLLDEPTSALDSVTEAGLQRSLDRLSQGRTTIVVAHRLKTIRSADRIIVMDKGEIVQVGTHESLIAEGGIYANLYQEQTQEDLGGVCV